MPGNDFFSLDCAKEKRFELSLGGWPVSWLGGRGAISIRETRSGKSPNALGLLCNKKEKPLLITTPLLKLRCRKSVSPFFRARFGQIVAMQNSQLFCRPAMYLLKIRCSSLHARYPSGRGRITSSTCGTHAVAGRSLRECRDRLRGRVSRKTHAHTG